MNSTNSLLPNPAPEEQLDRASVIARIRTALKARSGKRWSVTGGRGTGEAYWD